MAKLPTVTSPLPRDLQQFVQRVREALDSGGPDAVVTARQLIAAGVVDSSAGGGVAPIGGTVDPPRAPSGLTASGALASIIVSWNGPQYKGHAYTEIWAHTSDLLGDAVLVGMTAGNNFAHNIGNAAVRYYWVRNVNQNGVVSAFNATNGTQGATGQDPAYLLTVLTDEITATQLASSLGTRIDLIDAADTVVGSVNERVKIERLARQSSDSTINSAISSEESARQSADAATTSQLNIAISQTQNNTAAVVSEQTTRADADSAAVSQLNGVVAEVQQNNAAIATESTARADADSASAAQTTVLSSAVNNAQAAIVTESTARASNDTANASQITTLQSSVGGNTASISTQQTAVNGLEAQYTVKIDNNGAVAGFGLASTTTGSGNITSEFIVNADRFAIMRGGSDSTAGVVPFAVQASEVTINGETVPVGVYMDTAFIKNGTITNAKIGSLTADKITASLLNTVDFYGNTIAGSSIYLGGTVTYNTDSDGNNIGIQSIASPKVAMTSTGATFAVDAFTIDNPGGTDATPFSVTNNVVSIDSALIKDGTITNAMIGNTIQSTDFAAGSAGWRIKKNGNAELNNATFRGTLDVGGSSGSRMTITSTKLRVYDGNTLRVKIGDLS